jgi:aryl-alcohol dehydrogenase-like predicted oxidoreductase
MESAVNDGAMVNRVGLSRKHIFDAVDASVERLGTYIDLLQIHRLDRETPMEEIMGALNDVVQSGKVRYIGASSVCAFPRPVLTLPVKSLTDYLDGGMGVSADAEHR